MLIAGEQWADCTQFQAVLDKIRVPRKAGRPRTRGPTASRCSNSLVRRWLRQLGIRHTIPEKTDSRAARLRKGTHGGRPPSFDRQRNAVERAINRLKRFRAAATRYDKRGYVFLGTATIAALAIWLRT